MWSPLLEYQRNGLADRVIHGSISWVEGKNEVHSMGEKGPFYGRSLLKPFQAKAIASSLDEFLDSEEKALAVASHNGEAFHVEVVSRMLSPQAKNFLKTPPSAPLMVSCTSGLGKTRLQHPCSGKHAAILMACELHGWSRENYTSREHPYYQAYLETITKLLGGDYKPDFVAPDGCGLSTSSFSLKELATLYSSLVREKEKDWIWKAAASHPELIGGEGRLDSYILRVCEGRVFAKEGADGLLGLGIEHPSYPEGLGVVIKLAHGWDMKSMSFVASRILRSLGFLVGNPYAEDEEEVVVSFDVTPN